MFKEKIFPSFDSVLIKTKQGDLVGGGNNVFGQLGIPFYEYSTIQKPIKIIPKFKGDSQNSNTKSTQNVFQNFKVKTIANRLSDHAIFLTKQGKLYSCGWNEYATNGKDSVSTKKHNNTEEIKYFKDKKVETIFNGFFQSYFLMKDGRLFGCGSSFYGIGNTKPHLKIKPMKFIVPIEIDLHFLGKGDGVKDIKGSKKFSLFLSNKGKVYSIGYGNDGELGLGINQFHTKIMKQIEHLKDIRIVQINCGSRHSFFLSSNNEVYACGDNSSGQTGLNTLTSTFIPSVISSLLNKKVVSIRCGGHHSFFITNKSQIYGCGHNAYFQLGLSGNRNKVTAITIPTLLTQFYKDVNYKFVDVYCSAYGSYFVNLFGEIYSCGKNHVGEALLGFKSNSIEIPKKIKGVKIKLERIGDEKFLGKQIYFNKIKNCIYSDIKIVLNKTQ